MKRAIVASIVCVALAATVWGQAERRKLPGSEPYTPTKLEWLTVSLNALNNPGQDRTIMLLFTSDASTDTVTIHARHLAATDRATLKQYVEESKDLARTMAKQRGWDKWLKIKEDVAEGEAKK